MLHNGIAARVSLPQNELCNDGRCAESRCGYFGRIGQFGVLRMSRTAVAAHGSSLDAQRNHRHGSGCYDKIDAPQSIVVGAVVGCVETFFEAVRMGAGAIGGAVYMFFFAVAAVVVTAKGRHFVVRRAMARYRRHARHAHGCHVEREHQQRYDFAHLHFAIIPTVRSLQGFQSTSRRRRAHAPARRRIAP